MKKMLSVVLAIVLALSVITPMTALAEDYSYLQANGWFYRYYTRRGVARLDYYNGNAENLVIPDHILAIPVEGFAEDITYRRISVSVKTITFDLQVTEIPNDFANGCTSLESVTLPNSVHTIGKDAFNGCTLLTSINLPSSLQTIGDTAFRGCSELALVTLPASVRTLGDYAFQNCSGLQTVTLKSGLRSIGNSAFSGCKAMKSITVPETVNSIGKYAFRDCANLESAHLPTNLKVISEKMFLDCTELTTVNFPVGLYSIQDQAFCGCSDLKKVTLPSELRNLGTGAFQGCTLLSSITIPGSVGIISESAFEGCVCMETATVGYGVHTIEKYAFVGCGAYSFSGFTITIPYSVMTVGEVIEGNDDGYPAFSPNQKKYLDGEKRFLDRIIFGYPDDKVGFRYDLIASVNDAVTENRPVPRNPVFKTLSDLPLHVFACREALFLCVRCENCQHQLTFTARCMNVFIFKKYIYTKLLQFPYRCEKNNRVT